jgi:hypothetical protein
VFNANGGHASGAATADAQCQHDGKTQSKSNAIRHLCEGSQGKAIACGRGKNALHRRLVAARALGNAEIGPHDRSVIHAPSEVGVFFDIDQRIGASKVLTATSTAIGVAARVEHGCDDRIVTRFQTQIMKRIRTQRKERNDVVRHDPLKRFGHVRTAFELPLIGATIELNAFCATWSGIGFVGCFVARLPDEVGV